MSLSRAVIVAASEPLHPEVAKRLVRIHEKAGALQLVWIAVNRPGVGGENKRVYDLALDRVFSVTRSRLLHWVDVADEDHGERAAELDGLLFPTGLDFLRLPYAEQWAECERRIVLIAEDELGDELEDLVDARFVKRLHAAHADYGRVLGITEQPGTVDPGRVIDALSALRTELVGFARLVLGLTDEDDDAAVAAAEAQLEPILRYRKPRRSPGDADDDAVDEVVEEPVEAPLPDVPLAEVETEG